MFLLDLNLTDVAWMLNDLGNVRLVCASDLTSDSLRKISESTVHPVLPENTDTIAEGRKVGLDHAKRSMDGPENEEDDEQMMHVPKAFEVGTSSFLSSCERHRIQCDEHDISTPSRTCSKIGENKAHETEIVACRKTCKIVPVSNRVDPGKEYNGPCDQLVKGDVLVERNDVVKWCSTSHGN